MDVTQLMKDSDAERLSIWGGGYLSVGAAEHGGGGPGGRQKKRRVEDNQETTDRGDLSERRTEETIDKRGWREEKDEKTEERREGWMREKSILALLIKIAC